jgi:hypothetical protein
LEEEEEDDTTPEEDEARGRGGLDIRNGISFMSMDVPLSKDIVAKGGGMLLKCLFPVCMSILHFYIFYISTSL